MLLAFQIDGDGFKIFGKRASEFVAPMVATACRGGKQEKGEEQREEKRRGGTGADI